VGLFAFLDTVKRYEGVGERPHRRLSLIASVFMKQGREEKSASRRTIHFVWRSASNPGSSWMQ